MGRDILFVTKGNEDYEEGFSYVFDLSKILRKSIVVLMMYDKSLIESFEESMAAAAFAEAGETATAQEISGEWRRRIESDMQKKTDSLIKKYGSPTESVKIRCEAGDGDIVSTIKKIINTGASFEMVLLSPALTNSKSIKKLLRNISIPLVTMSRLSNAGT